MLVEEETCRKKEIGEAKNYLTIDSLLFSIVLSHLEDNDTSHYSSYH